MPCHLILSLTAQLHARTGIYNSLASLKKRIAAHFPWTMLIIMTMWWVIMFNVEISFLIWIYINFLVNKNMRKEEPNCVVCVNVTYKYR